MKPRVLLIDNYDSFTYNLFQYLAELGGEISVFRNDKVSVAEIESMNPSHIVISPGPGEPDDAGVSMEAVEHFGDRKPILGVCLGHQAIGKVYGGKIERAEKLLHGKTSSVYHDGGTIYQGVKNPFTATRYHSLVVQTETVPDCLEISARTEEGTVMGLRHKDFPVEGVQFHPESILTDVGKKILGNFLEIRGNSPAS